MDVEAESQFCEAVEALRHAELLLGKLNRHQPGNVSMGLTTVANQLWLARAGLLALGVSIAPGANTEPWSALPEEVP